MRGWEYLSPRYPVSSETSSLSFIVNSLLSKFEREGKEIVHARRLLGHSNISTMQRYMHLDDRELADAQDLIE